MAVEPSTEHSDTDSDSEVSNTKLCIAAILKNPLTELCVIFLLLVDLLLVALELGIETSVICIGGRLVDAHNDVHDPHMGAHDPHMGAHEPHMGAQDPHMGAHSPHLGATNVVSNVLPGFHAGTTAYTDRRLSVADSVGAGHAAHMTEHPTQVLECYGPHHHVVHELEHHAHLGSVAILVVFAIELVLKIWVIDGWIKDCFHKLDVFVVFVSLTIDTVVLSYLDSMMDKNAAAQADFVVLVLLFVRFWRVVRIVHGFVEVAEVRAGIAVEMAEHDLELKAQSRKMME